MADIVGSSPTWTTKLVYSSAWLERPREHVLTDTGEVLKEPLSTSDLSKQEFNEYIDKIIRFAAEVLDIQIKYPNEQTEMLYEEPTNN